MKWLENCYWCGKEPKVITLTKSKFKWYDIICVSKVCRNKKFFSGRNIEVVVGKWNEFNDTRRK